ncbi:unnamed protein product [Lactuca virosa]|uniref:Uncharacterized protein n=1 Tax=Lactuca virosa TaxID=75947 RepID=A0AAU9P466_9ASTR|nr:unnamed protein product [Lactuca virosa]
MLESRIISKVSGMVKASESVILEKVDYTDQNNELRVKNQRSDFMGEVKNLKSITKERNILFVQEVKKVREDEIETGSFYSFLHIIQKRYP